MITSNKIAVIKNGIGPNGVGVFRTKWTCENACHIIEVGGKSCISRTEISIGNKICFEFTGTTLSPDLPRNKNSQYAEKTNHDAMIRKE